MAERQLEGNLGKSISLQDLAEPGGVNVADPMKIDTELREIFTNIRHADPSAEGKDGNFGGNIIPFTTPSAIDTQLMVEHKLGQKPVGWQPVAAALKDYSVAGSLYCIKDADDTYLYLAVRAASDVSRKTAVRVW